MIVMDSCFKNTLTWDVALSRNDRVHKTDYGILCDLGCVMVIGSLKSAGKREVPINLTLNNVVVTKADGSKYQLKSSRRTFIIADPLTTDIEDVDNPLVHLNMSPNPASSLVYLDFRDYQPTSTLTEINLYNLTGQLLLSQKKEVRNEERVTLDIGEIPEGMYWIQIINGSAQLSEETDDSEVKK